MMTILAGMLVGLRITLSMGLGATLAYIVMPSILVDNGWVAEAKYKPVLIVQGRLSRNVTHGHQ
jgi:hypothetical protein